MSLYHFALNNGADLATITSLILPHKDPDQLMGLDVCERLTRLDSSLEVLWRTSILFITAHCLQLEVWRSVKYLRLAGDSFVVFSSVAMPPRKRRRYKDGGREHYEYLPLREAILREGEVNFYGAISEYEKPKPTRGSDFLCTMTVVDMSFDDPGLRLLVFAPVSSCPVVKSLGDIIRLHRVKVSNYKDSPQAVASMNKGSSFILLDGKNGNSYKAYQKSHPAFTFEHHDLLTVEHMRKWISAHPLVTRTSDYLVQISGIKDNYFDLCCKILYVDDRYLPQRVTIIYVWDGTDAAPRTLPVLQEEDSDRAPLDTLEAKQIPLPLPPRDVLCDLPPVGTMLPIIPVVPIDSLSGQMPQRGDWVKFRNLAVRTHAGMVEALLTRESKISLLSTDAQLVKNCESAYQERILSEYGHLPHSSPKPPQSLTVTDFENVQFSTLREVLTHEKVTYKFRCLVRVISTFPTQVCNFCVPLPANEDKSGTESSPVFVYGVRFTLEDPTGRLHAFLFAEDGAKFFNGHPAADLYSDSSLVGALERKVQKLLGYKYLEDGRPAPERDPPWIKVCLKSYYTDESKQWESRCYRIFGTTFPG
ncbi:hypothetical protein R1sor_003087 [Riccia sorocarpa]|uniref:Telomeric single stranded DNA binding POT1/Cdc13 domain-containing protein n=1 Tax=Riccia sorocarpa TaxID=122646 RepID=A0ABD3H0J8_9MARC